MTRLVIPSHEKARRRGASQHHDGGRQGAAATGVAHLGDAGGGLNLTKSLANEYAADNIRVNTICIGLCAAPDRPPRQGRSRAHYAELDEAARAPRPRRPCAEFADLFAFLVSGRAGTSRRGDHRRRAGGPLAPPRPPEPSAGLTIEAVRTSLVERRRVEGLAALHTVIPLAAVELSTRP